MTQYKGQLEGFPEEVVEKMLERQVEQGNEKNVSVFEKDRFADKEEGGFAWNITEEGDSFWSDVIVEEDFERFFTFYPKEESSTQVETIVWRKWPCEYKPRVQYLVNLTNGDFVLGCINKDGHVDDRGDGEYDMLSIAAIAEVKGWQ